MPVAMCQGPLSFDRPKIDGPLKFAGPWLKITGPLLTRPLKLEKPMVGPLKIAGPLLIKPKV